MQEAICTAKLEAMPRSQLTTLTVSSARCSSAMPARRNTLVSKRGITAEQHTVSSRVLGAAELRLALQFGIFLAQVPQNRRNFFGRDPLPDLHRFGNQSLRTFQVVLAGRCFVKRRSGLYVRVGKVFCVECDDRVV